MFSDWGSEGFGGAPRGHSDWKARPVFLTRWERACLFVAEVAEALVEVAASVAAAAATTTSEVEAAAVSEAAAAAEEDLDEGAAAELLTEARTTDLQSK